MASQVSPGIVIKERDLSNAVITGAQQITAAFASTFQKGPINQIVNINSQKQMIDVFGKPSDANAEDWYVASEFLNYGGRLAIVRAATSVLNATATGTGVLVRNDLDFEAGTGSSQTFVAKTAGTWGNSLKVVVVDRGYDQIITFDKAPDVTPVVGSTLTFASGKTAVVGTYNSITREVAVNNVLGGLISAGDSITETEDPIASFTHNGVTEAGRTPGTYTPAAHAGGASFQVVVADAGAGVGGAVTVTLLTAGDGYEIGDTITLAGANTGGGTDIIVTVATILDDETGVSAVRDWYINTEIGTTGLTLASIGPRPGTSVYASSRGIANDEVHVIVIDTTGNISGSANTIVERFTYLSKLSDGKGSEGGNTYYKTVLNEQSSFVYTGADLATNFGDTAEEMDGDDFAIYGFTSTDLTGGTDDYSYDNGEVGNAYDLFLDTEETTVDFVLMGGSMLLESETKAKASKVISIAASRKDCIAFVSPHKGSQVGSSGALTTSQQKTNTINFFNGLTSTSYAVFDSGYKYFYDRFNDKYRYIPCNGDIAGLCVATSSALDDWYSPAGVNRGSLRNAVKLAYNPNKADRDELYQARINPIVSFTGSGVTLFGDKTALASPSAFDRINVRRLFLNIQKRAEGLAKQVLFDQNDETTRASFASALNSYMSEVQARRGVTDFLVVCDESNNTPDVIDRYEFVAEVYIKPTRSINYITVTLTATKSGVSFAEVVGR
jgi:hypothetical protein